MKILLIRANPRKTGHTQNMTDILLGGMKSGGADVTDIDIVNLNINSCVGCFRCWTHSPGKCVFNDDMAHILDLILDTDIIMCSTPLYYYQMNSHLNGFFERTLPLCKQGFQITPSGHMRNKVRYPDKWKNKKLGFISVCAFRSPYNFSSLKKTFRQIAEGMDVEICAELIRPESYILPFEQAKPKTIRSIKSAFEQAGIELARKGRVCKETSQKVCDPVSRDLGSFIRYTNTYWDTAAGMDKDANDFRKVCGKVIRNIHILMNEMSHYIDREATSHLKAKIQFYFKDIDFYYLLTVNRGECSLEERKDKDPALTVFTTSEDWASMFLREISPRDALLSKKIILKGDKSLFTRFDRYFPPPSM